MLKFKVIQLKACSIEELHQWHFEREEMSEFYNVNLIH